MPGIHIHLAIAKEYIKHHPEIKSQEAFFEGSIAPDFNEDKKKSHYTKDTSNKDLINYLNNKVHVYPFLQETNIKTDYNKGVFLHLITDKLFFTEFLDKEYLKSATYSEYINDLYYSYECTNPVIIKHYKLPMQKYEKRIEENINKMKKVRGIVEKEKNNILETNKLIEFINEMSLINLEEYQQKYKNWEGE